FCKPAGRGCGESGPASFGAPAAERNRATATARLERGGGGERRGDEADGAVGGAGETGAGGAGGELRGRDAQLRRARPARQPPGPAPAPAGGGTRVAGRSAARSFARAGDGSAGDSESGRRLRAARSVGSAGAPGVPL